jgi:hypothetical protein
MPTNPAAAVHRSGHVVKTGMTPLIATLVSRIDAGPQG